MISLIKATTSPATLEEWDNEGRCPLWYAVYTRSRHEQMVKNQLDGKGIENFLPFHMKVSQWKDRKKQIHVPLFPGYLFVKMFLRDRVEVLKTFGAVNVVGDGSSPVPIPEPTIRSVQAFMEKGLRYNPHPYLCIGNRIRIVEGPLIGLEGILLRKDNKDRLVLSVDLIQRSISIEIDRWKIEPVHSLS
jgi:transcription antitermination factor NusG